MKITKLSKSLLLSTFVMVFAAGSALAADFRVADKNNGNVNVGSAEIIKNLYTAGNIVSIDAPLQKNLYAAGNVVTVNGNVGGTVFSGAATLIIHGDVGGSVHGGGGSILIDSKIADDVLVGGGNVVLAQTSSVGEDVYIGGGTIDIQGPVSGNVLLGGGVITINSTIGGNVKIAAADKIKLGSNAKIRGNLEYASKNALEIAEGAIVTGETKQNPIKTNTNSKKGFFVALFSFAILIKVGGLIVVGLLLTYALKSTTEQITKESLNNFWKNLGIGLLSLIVTPIVAILLMITIIGIWLGVIVLLLYILSILLAISFSSIIFGSWILGVVKKSKDYFVNWKVVVGGVVAITIVGFIPIVGWIVCAIFLLISLGAMYRLAYGLRNSQTRMVA